MLVTASLRYTELQICKILEQGNNEEDDVDMRYYSGSGDT